MRVAAVVILYYPDKDVIANIKSYYDHVEKIYVIDNSEKLLPIKEELTALPKIEYYQDFQNRGIAERLNTACSKAIEEKYEWLLTMDQDTSFTPETITDYFTCVQNYSNAASVAMFGTKSDRNESKSSPICEVEEEDEIITSGSLLNLALFEKIGKFDEALFIDYVDNDYCYRATLSGYSILRLNNITIIHQLGNLVRTSSIKTLYLWKKVKMIHSPIRCYYLYRNMLYLENKYKKLNPQLAKLIRKNITRHVNKSILYGGREIETMKYIRLAKKDFKDNKMGKISTEI